MVCVDNADHPASLELHKIYCSLPDDEAAASGGIRVVDESGDDYVFATGAFVPIQLPERVRASLRGDASSS